MVRCRIALQKRRYYCKHCKKPFTESYDIVNKRCRISNSLKIEIRIKLMNISLTLKEIGSECGVSDTEVKNELLQMMKDYPKITSLKGIKVISFMNIKRILNLESMHV